MLAPGTISGSVFAGWPLAPSCPVVYIPRPEQRIFACLGRRQALRMTLLQGAADVLVRGVSNLRAPLCSYWWGFIRPCCSGVGVNGQLSKRILPSATIALPGHAWCRARMCKMLRLLVAALSQQCGTSRDSVRRSQSVWRGAHDKIFR